MDIASIGNRLSLVNKNSLRAKLLNRLNFSLRAAARGRRSSTTWDTAYGYNSDCHEKALEDVATPTGFLVTIDSSNGTNIVSTRSDVAMWRCVTAPKR
jgi:hypothetical protein